LAEKSRVILTLMPSVSRFSITGALSIVPGTLIMRFGRPIMVQRRTASA
jgi:hypothetical protein